jgi:hypothetical protein
LFFRRGDGCVGVSLGRPISERPSSLLASSGSAGRSALQSWSRRVQTACKKRVPAQRFRQPEALQLPPRKAWLLWHLATKAHACPGLKRLTNQGSPSTDHRSFGLTPRQTALCFTAGPLLAGIELALSLHGPLCSQKCRGSTGPGRRGDGDTPILVGPGSALRMLRDRWK